MVRLIVVAALLAMMAPPKRIVSLAPSVTEMLFALGLGDRVLGVTTYCHYPPEVTKLPKVGTYLKPDIERILSLRPDLVVMQKTAVHSKKSLGSLPVLELKHDTIADIHDSLTMIGNAAGVPDRAQKLNASIRAELDAVRKRGAGRRPTSVMFVVGRTPGALERIVVVGKASYLGQVIELAGGRNVFADSPAAYPKVSLEEILARNPDVIVDMGEMADTVGVTDAQKQAVIAMWSRYPSIAAVRNKRVHAVASDIFVVPGPRVVEVAREFGRMLHP
jgi:iron complex transport system substrate-binding protein